MAKQKIRVSSITEVDVKDAITTEIEKAVKTIVDDCTKEYKNILGRKNKYQLQKITC